MGRDVGDLVHGTIEGFFVRARRLSRSADLSHELQRSGVHLFVVGGGLEVVEVMDASAHASRLTPHPVRVKEHLHA